MTRHFPGILRDSSIISAHSPCLINIRLPRRVNMLILTRSSIVMTIIMLAACGGGGSNSDTASDISATDDSASTTDEPTSTAVTSGSTDGVLCDYSDTTFNSQASLTYTSISEWTCTGTTRELTANGIPEHSPVRPTLTRSLNKLCRQATPSSRQKPPRLPC
jgi:hypothetical protein